MWWKKDLTVPIPEPDSSEVARLARIYAQWTPEQRERLAVRIRADVAKIKRLARGPVPGNEVRDDEP